MNPPGTTFLRGSQSTLKNTFKELLSSTLRESQLGDDSQTYTIGRKTHNQTVGVAFL